MWRRYTFNEDDFGKCSKRIPFISDKLYLVAVKDKKYDIFEVYFLESSRKSEEERSIFSSGASPRITSFSALFKVSGPKSFKNLVKWLEFTSQLGWDAIFQLAESDYQEKEHTETKGDRLFAYFLLYSLISIDQYYAKEYLELVLKDFSVENDKSLQYFELFLGIETKLHTSFRGKEKLFDEILSLINFRTFKKFNFSGYVEYYKCLTDVNFFLSNLKSTAKRTSDPLDFQNLLNSLVTDRKTLLITKDQKSSPDVTPPSDVMFYYTYSNTEGIYLHRNYVRLINNLFKIIPREEVLKNSTELAGFVPLLSIGDKNYLLEYRDEILRKYTDQPQINYANLMKELKPLLDVVLLEVYYSMGGDCDPIDYQYSTLGPCFNLLYFYSEDNRPHEDDEYYNPNIGGYYYLIMRNHERFLKPIFNLIPKNVPEMSELKELTEKIKGIAEPLDLAEENEKAESLWLDSDFHIAKLQNEASLTTPTVKNGMIEYYGCSLYEQEAKRLQDLEEIIGGPPTIIEESKTSKSLGRFGVILEENHIESLQIFNVGLSELPESIGNLCSLEELMCWSNKLQNLPKNFRNLRNLKSLTLSENQLTSLPDTLIGLKNLYSIHLSNNHLSTVPDDLWNLARIGYIDLRNNNLINLSDSVMNLKGLRRRGDLQVDPEVVDRSSKKVQEWIAHNN